MPRRIAYLNTQYPSLSHTFIEREIRAVRACGIQVDTFTINPPRPQDVLGDRHAEEAKNTYILKPAITTLLWSQFRGKLRWPINYFRAFLESQRLFPTGIKNRLTSVGYLWEAARLALELDKRGIRHIHCHMANNGAAVALLACIIDPRLTYSLSIHGSAEFFDVFQLNLKAKTERATFVRCISNFCKAQIMAWSDPSAWDRFHVVHCAVDPDVLTPLPSRKGPGEGSSCRHEPGREGVGLPPNRSATVRELTPPLRDHAPTSPTRPFRPRPGRPPRRWGCATPSLARSSGS